VFGGYVGVVTAAVQQRQDCEQKDRDDRPPPEAFTPRVVREAPESVARVAGVTPESVARVAGVTPESVARVFNVTPESVAPTDACVGVTLRRLIVVVVVVVGKVGA
jgi:hypothetical protein